MNFQIRTTQYNKIYKILGILTIASDIKISDLEKAIISTLISNGYTSLTPESKEVVRKALNKDKFLTNNYIKRLKDKNIIGFDSKGVLNIDRGIVEAVENNSISFNFIAS